MEQITVNIQPYLNALHKIEEQFGVWCSASIKLHPDGDSAVMVENTLRDTKVAVDFDQGDDIMDAIHCLAERAKEIF
jgi:hypothetical protein